MTSKPKIYLASASPRRKELLKKVVKNFQVIVSQFNENSIKAKSPRSFVKLAALGKTKDIAEKIKAPAIIIGCDTIVVVKNKILGKPKDKQEAQDFLKLLSGTKHRVLSGLALIYKDKNKMKIITAIEETKIKFKKLTQQEIEEYVDKFKPFDKAGGYGVQETGDIFVEQIEGEFDNVVGLPTKLLKNMIYLLNGTTSLAYKENAKTLRWNSGQAKKHTKNH